MHRFEVIKKLVQISKISEAMSFAMISEGKTMEVLSFEMMWSCKVLKLSRFVGINECKISEVTRSTRAQNCKIITELGVCQSEAGASHFCFIFLRQCLLWCQCSGILKGRGKKCSTLINRGNTH